MDLLGLCLYLCLLCWHGHNSIENIPYLEICGHRMLGMPLRSLMSSLSPASNISAKYKLHNTRAAKELRNFNLRVTVYSAKRSNS
jgi:hypothetical protein